MAICHRCYISSRETFSQTFCSQSVLLLHRFLNILYFYYISTHLLVFVSWDFLYFSMAALVSRSSQFQSVCTFGTFSVDLLNELVLFLFFFSLSLFKSIHFKLFSTLLKLHNFSLYISRRILSVVINGNFTFDILFLFF